MAEFKRVKIKFSVSGYVEQYVIITNPKMTPAKLQKLLASGKVATTIQDNGAVQYVKDGRTIGAVDSVDNECEYYDFEVTKN